jgi:TetR/AcrR family transcriptional regulator, ethionamide resistance regulator
MTDMTRRTVGRRQAVGRRRVVDTDSASAADSIFAATARLLARQSFAEISVAQILTEAKVSRATFYFYFASKFSVLSGLLERAMDDIFETVQPFLARSGKDSPTVALQRSIRAVTQAWHRHRPVLRAANHHWHSEPELRDLWLAIAERFIAAGADEIERERAAGMITSPVPSRTLAATLFWGTERVLYIAGLGVEPSLADEEAAVEALVSMWLGTLYAP